MVAPSQRRTLSPNAHPDVIRPSEHENTQLSVDEVIRVRELPIIPRADAHYAFDDVARADVTEFNHGLHKYPAKFIPQLPRWALNYRKDYRTENVLDPFCGSGTTLIEAGMRGNHAFGYDVSPLAITISKAKTSHLSELTIETENIIGKITKRAMEIAPHLLDELICNQECLGLHKTWSFWFRPLEMARLLAIRDAIAELHAENSELATFLLASLSSISKASSFLNEDQIKVRYDATKQPLDPFISFPPFAAQALNRQRQLGKIFQRADARFSVELGSATSLQLEEASIDRVITSPPYINAVDYTMAHKYNLFILGLIQPEDFKAHCREYIGVTERAVRAADLVQKPEVGNELVDEQVHQLWLMDTPLSRNRAFVVAQYFAGMLKALEEMYRVVRPDGKVIMVIGGTNRICGREIETAALVEHLAHKVGLKTELSFYHHIANRSSMRLNRSATGGQLQFESIYVFNRP